MDCVGPHLSHSMCVYGSGNITGEELERLFEPEYHEGFCKTLSSRNGFINKSGTMAISMNILTWNILLLSKNLQVSIECWKNELPGMSCHIGFAIQSGDPWKYIHRNNKTGLNRLYLCVCMCIATHPHHTTHTHAAITVKKKRSLRVGGPKKCWKKKKNGGSDIIIFQFKT